MQEAKRYYELATERAKRFPPTAMEVLSETAFLEAFKESPLTSNSAFQSVHALETLQKRERDVYAAERIRAFKTPKKTWQTLELSCAAVSDP